MSKSPAENELRPKSLKDAPTVAHAVIIAAGLAMIGLSLYLTNHYFNVYFPEDLGAGSGLCNINAFFNCDQATLSPFSNIMGVPISLFGLLIGIFLFTPYLFGAEKAEGTNFFILALNAVGCLFLFFYSLVALGSLCPMCTLYYLASWLAFWAYYRWTSARTPHWGFLAGYGAIALLAGGVFYSNVQQKFDQKEKMNESMVKQYKQMNNLGSPDMESPYKLAEVKGSEAPIQMAVFSDFQCPACKALSRVTDQIEKRYSGQVEIQYFFYPLDHNCNPEMKRPLHDLACQAAYLATCLPEKFGPVHDEIFAHQEDLSLEWLKDYARDEGVLECMESSETKEKVQELISASKPFSVKSTPTMVINGVKVEGVFPLTNLAPIFEYLIEKSEE